MKFRSLLVAAAVTIEYATAPSTRTSSTPVTVTVCGVFQFPLVNVTDDGLTVPSVMSFDESPTVTFAVGCDVSTTVNVAVPPAFGRRQPARRRHRDASRIVIGVRHRHVSRIQPVVVRICTSSRQP